ncbi:transglutaminase family protein [Azospira oryzae]|uniref:transglutaminase family protein n=1 Tax=Azospira oryzae TaxID=146939 RepID=UPI001962C89A|nr:transglutaminase family protein [Azospira oryzae]
MPLHDPVPALEAPLAAAYRITHATEYRYGAPVALSQQLPHLTPRPLPWQTVREHRLEVEPLPSLRLERWDAFGNPVTQLAFDGPHDSLTVRAETEIEVLPRFAGELPPGQPWEGWRQALVYRGALPPPAELLEAVQFAFPSPFVSLGPAFAAYAAPSFTPGRGLLAAARDLMGRIHAEFEFDPQATSVATPVAEVLARKRGVCQDFAHLMLACLRSLGLPARYVSGYLLTEPPPGSPRLIGADASHAWVSLFCPGLGWVDLDPTNDLIPDSRHITLAWGRDFGDVSPMRGVILGGGAHELEVAVTVLPLAAPA